MKIRVRIASIFLALTQLSFAHYEHAKKPNLQVKLIQEEWGIDANKKEASRTIVIKMTDKMQFSPEKIDLRLGETVRFEVKNDDKVMYEMIGTKPI